MGPVCGIGHLVDAGVHFDITGHTLGTPVPIGDRQQPWFGWPRSRDITSVRRWFADARLLVDQILKLSKGGYNNEAASAHIPA